MSEVTGQDIERRTLRESQRRLDNAVTKIGRNMAGPWGTRLNALHAELRATVVGRALPGWGGTINDGTMWRLSDEGLQKHRGPKTALDSKAVRALPKVARTLPRGTLTAIYPEIAAAQQAIELLEGGKVPERFRRTNRIIVDEAQDLTLVELKLISTLCRSIGDADGWSPWLLIAGDAGQTVHPTGFNWNQTAAMLSKDLGPTKSFHLDGHVRCPQRIAEIVNRSAELYARLNKEMRPEKQHRQTGGEHVDAHVMHVAIEDADEAERLTRQAADADHTVMITTSGQVPDWVPEAHRKAVLTPADAKGLEYQTVCVLDGGRTLRELQERTYREATDTIEEESARTAIDGLRVAISRATEGLVLVDMQPGQQRGRCGQAAPREPGDLERRRSRRVHRPDRHAERGTGADPHPGRRRAARDGAGAGLAARSPGPEAARERRAAERRERSAAPPAGADHRAADGRATARRSRARGGR